MLRLAKYNFIAFCDSDDIWLPNKLEFQLNEMEKENAPVCCSGFVKKHFRTGRESSAMFPQRIITHSDLVRKCSIIMSSAVVNRSITGNFEMPASRRRQDFAMWLQLTQQGHWALGLDEVLVKVGYGNRSVSSNKLMAAYYHWKTVRNYSNTPLGAMMINFCSYAINGIKKYLLR